MTQKIVLVYPSSSPDIEHGEVDFSRYKSVPIGLLNLASWLDFKGYKVKVIDGRIYPKSQTLEMLRTEVAGAAAVAFGITTVQIKHGLQLSQEVRNIDKNIPIIWGGFHPTLFPEQTARESLIDYVLYGEVEYSFTDLLDFINGNKQIEEIKGIIHKKDGILIKNPLHPGIDPNDLPLPNYELLDIEKYIEREYITNLGKVKKIRALDINTSRGCPYRCNFCPNTMPEFKKYRVLKKEKYIQILDTIIPKYKLDHIWFFDELFFVEKTKVQAITQHIIDKKYNITWESNARTDQFNDRLLNDELLAQMKKSGCMALRMGMESGSDRILELMKKDAKVDSIIKAVTQCEKYGIMPVGNFMIGFPTETKEEMLETAKLVLHLKQISPNGLFYSPGLLRPYPGTEMYEIAKHHGGMEEPTTLQGWADRKIDVGLFSNPRDLYWITDPEWVVNFQVYLYITTIYLTHRWANKKLSLPWRIVGGIANYRINNNLWLLSIEPKILIQYKKIMDGDGKLSKLLKKISGYNV